MVSGPVMEKATDEMSGDLLTDVQPIGFGNKSARKLPGVWGYPRPLARAWSNNEAPIPTSSTAKSFGSYSVPPGIGLSAANSVTLIAAICGPGCVFAGQVQIATRGVRQKTRVLSDGRPRALHFTTACRLTVGLRLAESPSRAPRESISAPIRFPRHTFASLLIQNEEPLTYVKEQLGHSSIEITVDVCGHLVPGGANRQAVNRLPSLGGVQALPQKEKQG